MLSEHEGRDCIFCHLLPTRAREVLAENDSFFAVFDEFPVNKGHVLLIPKRHLLTPFELTRKEGGDLVELLSLVKASLDEQFQPDGYNVGINTGQAAGQTISHLHIHLIPRYRGDVEKPRGGIRNLKEALIPY